ncbi:MAG: VanW family protein [Eubacterium sp.]|nr:VanW family protein [Eubacterium sp.]
MRTKRRPHYRPALLVIAIMIMLILSYVIIFYMNNKPDDNRIIPGVYVEGISIGGMTAAEAQAQIDTFAQGRINRTLYVDVDGKTVDTPLAQLDYRLEENDVVNQAMKLGKEGNVFTNYAEIKKIEAEHRNYSLSFAYSEAKVTKFVKKKCAKKTKMPVDATVKLVDGTLTYTKSKTGLKVDVEATVGVIADQINQTPEGDIRAQAVTTVREPKVSEETARRCKDKIGSFSTNYSAGNETRSKNLANAARLINGSVVMPGETFSVHDHITPLTEENGYFAAPSYSNGEVVDSIGGGVCQVSTTLYNAVLRAELEVVERSPHSMVVSYVKPSMDAAIAGDYKDFKFRNNTEVPVMIQGSAGGGTIWFNVYGEETRSPDRKVEFVSEVLKKTEPGEDIVTYDPTQPPSYEVVTQSAHIGYEAVLWKVVTENGKSEKKQINSSSYKAVPRHVTKGSGAAPEPRKTPKPAQESEAPAESEEPEGAEEGTEETE